MRESQQAAYVISKALNAIARGIARDEGIRRRVQIGLDQIAPGDAHTAGTGFTRALIEAMDKGNGVT